MPEVFLRQSEAIDYVSKIPDRIERVLTDLALNRAIGFVITDGAYNDLLAKHPFDLLLFSRAIHSFFREKDVVLGVLHGDIESIDDLDPFGSMDD